MLQNIVKILVLLFPLTLTPIEAFWWRSSTTEPPATQPETVMKQIPLTYFRTFTYQPMAGNPLQFPLMSSTDYVSNYAAMANNPYFNPMISMMPQMAGGAAMGNGAGSTAGVAASNAKDIKTSASLSGVRPPKSYAGMNVVRSLNNGQLIPSTTSSSTTTTTAKPTTKKTTTTTTTTTTSTTTPSTTTTSTTDAPTSTESSADINSSGMSLTKADSMFKIESAYPAFNHKVYSNHFNINYNRPVYPYPEYSVYKPMNSPNNGLNEDIKSAPSTNSATTNIEFVPCMCPVNIQAGYPSGIPITGNPSSSMFSAQSRINPDVDTSLESRTEDVSESKDSDLLEPQVPLMDFAEDLQMMNVDGKDEVVTQSETS